MIISRPRKPHGIRRNLPSMPSEAGDGCEVWCRDEGGTLVNVWV